MKIDYRKEIIDIEKELQLNFKVNYLKSVGTEENFWKIVLSNPVIIHFTGHGV